MIEVFPVSAILTRRSCIRVPAAVLLARENDIENEGEFFDVLVSVPKENPVEHDRSTPSLE